MTTEGDTCRKLVVHRPQEAGWDDAPDDINEKRIFTDGRIIFIGDEARRNKLKRVDYIPREATPASTGASACTPQPRLRHPNS